MTVRCPAWFPLFLKDLKAVVCFARLPNFTLFKLCHKIFYFKFLFLIFYYFLLQNCFNLKHDFFLSIHFTKTTTFLRAGVIKKPMTNPPSAGKCLNF